MFGQHLCSFLCNILHILDDTDLLGMFIRGADGNIFFRVRKWEHTDNLHTRIEFFPYAHTDKSSVRALKFRIVLVDIAEFEHFLRLLFHLF